MKLHNGNFTMANTDGGILTIDHLRYMNYDIVGGHRAHKMRRMIRLLDKLEVI